ncbi:MAG TPA: chemotaxis protein CheA [Candidatus Dormibacteraeota bacterium]|jgi:two-component system, chemotaxis family, sensor kinase CheA|nr:chemotaxis protein CheA [Candidatus Dormibacteraeota bacterium]
MSRQPEDRGAELRALFFESAYELLQALNEGGLQLETHPGDEEVLRGVRRAVHTLKGDAAACGFAQLSELAHALEEVLTPEVVLSRGAGIAEIVLSAADIFGAMLFAYERSSEPPSGIHLQKMIRDLLEGPTSKKDLNAYESHGADSKIGAKFAWTEYEQLMISEAVHRGESVYNLALRVDPKSLMRAAAFQLIRNVLHGSGTVIALRPEDNIAAATVEVVEAALATNLTAEVMAQRCRIPAIVSDIRIERAATAETAEHELLDDLLEVQANLAHAEHPEDQAPGAGNAIGTAVTAITETSLRVDAARIDAVMNLVGELIIGRSMLNRTLAEFDKNHARDPVRTKLADAMAFQTRVLDELHKCVLKIRMVPVEQLFRRFPRVVRDVAKQCGKDVALQVAGQNTDLDKGILDSLAEPLMHLVRNAVDHGIDPVDERVAAGKPARGTVFLNAYHQGAQVVIEVRDDGRGMDTNKLREQAVEKAILKQDEAKRLNEQEALNLIFEPGFSTAAAVTEVSGRGVGMDVVRSAMGKLKGTVHVSTQLGKGTTIQLRAPLTLASIQTLLFRVGGRLFAVPLSSVVEITRIREDEIHMVDQREILRLRDQLLTLVRLNRLDHIHAVAASPSSPTKKTRFVIVIGAAEKRFGLLVDSLVGEEELVIKALPSDIVSSDLVSGASILGDGTVVLILNVPAVVSRFSKALPMEAIA